MYTHFNKVMFLCFTLFSIPLLVLVFTIDPKKGGLVAIVGFLVSIFFVTFSFVSLVIYNISKRLNNNEIIFSNIKDSLRVGLLAGIFLITLLLLGSIRLLTWWDGILLAFSLVLVELYFKSERTVTK